MAKATKEEFFKRLDLEGIAKVRSNQKTNVYLDPELKLWAIEWVHLFEEAADRSREATSAEQLALARSAAANADAALAEAREANNIARSAKKICCGFSGDCGCNCDSGGHSSALLALKPPSNAPATNLFCL